MLERVTKAPENPGAGGQPAPRPDAAPPSGRRKFVLFADRTGNAFRTPFRSVVRLVCAVVFVAAAHAAWAEPAPYRPLVFVPGILGSELLDQSNEPVWGGIQS